MSWKTFMAVPFASLAAYLNVYLKIGLTYLTPWFGLSGWSPVPSIKACTEAHHSLVKYSNLCPHSAKPCASTRHDLIDDDCTSILRLMSRALPRPNPSKLSTAPGSELHQRPHVLTCKSVEKLILICTISTGPPVFCSPAPTSQLDIEFPQHSAENSHQFLIRHRLSDTATRPSAESAERTLCSSHVESFTSKPSLRPVEERLRVVRCFMMDRVMRGPDFGSFGKGLPVYLHATGKDFASHESSNGRWQSQGLSDTGPEILAAWEEWTGADFLKRAESLVYLIPRSQQSLWGVQKVKERSC